MTPGAAVRSVLRQYASFSGRARRSEYWWWVLLSNIGQLAVIVAFAGLVDGTGDPDVVANAAALVVLLVIAAQVLPTVAVTVRRLHDTDRSGWWYLLNLLPLVGPAWLLVLCCLGSEPWTNRHGPSPRRASADVAGTAVGST